MATAVTSNTKGLPVRLMFQDEARFGRLSDPRRCWAPWPLRPLVQKALIREYVYAYAAVTPADGQLEWMLGSRMDTATMGVFLQQVSEHYAGEFVVMVLDGAPSHRSGKLEIPENMVLLALPPYSPELGVSCAGKKLIGRKREPTTTVVKPWMHRNSVAFEELSVYGRFVMAASCFI